MRTDSSASRTCGAAASASEYTATPAIPMSRTVRSTRRAISPRLATRTLRMRGTGASFTGLGNGLEEPPRLAGRAGACYHTGSDPRQAPVLRRRQPALRYEDAARAPQPEPGRVDLRRRVAVYPALHKPPRPPPLIR